MTVALLVFCLHCSGSSLKIANFAGMNSIQPDDTICAISTPPGAGGIAVIRVSGPQAVNAVEALWRGKPLSRAESHTAHLGEIVDPLSGEPVDQAVATLFRAPRSYTGQDTVELSVHGSTWIQAEVLRLLCGQSGVRLAEPGEFTRRAFASGRIDLTRAEAVADLIAARSRAEARMAISQLRGSFAGRIDQLRTDLIDLASLLELELDFSEEEVEFASRTKLLDLARTVHTELSALAESYHTGAAIKDGIPVAIVGPTNAGKSSILNALLGDTRAIVSDIHGTTRDIVEDTLILGDYRIRLMDTAGLRQTADPVEAIGIDLSRRAATRATILIIVIDTTHPEELAETLGALPRPLPPVTLLVANKADLPHEADNLGHLANNSGFSPTSVIPTSTITGQGIAELRKAILDAIEGTHRQADIIVTNLRQARALQAAADAAADVIAALRANIPGDLIAQHLRQVLHHLAEITGAITTPTLLTTIFSRFCIGK